MNICFQQSLVKVKANYFLCVLRIRKKTFKKFVLSVLQLHKHTHTHTQRCYTYKDVRHMKVSQTYMYTPQRCHMIGCVTCALRLLSPDWCTGFALYSIHTAFLVLLDSEGPYSKIVKPTLLIVVLQINSINRASAI